MTDVGRPKAGTVEQYLDYLAAHRPKEYQLQMLRENALGWKSPAELAMAAGWRSHHAANLHYGKFAKRIGRSLGLTLVRYDRDGTEFFLSAIALERPGTKAGNWEYKLHPEFLQALRQLGLVAEEQAG